MRYLRISTRCWMSGIVALSLCDGGGDGAPLGLLLRLLAVDRSNLGVLLGRLA